MDQIPPVTGRDGALEPAVETRVEVVARRETVVAGTMDAEDAGPGADGRISRGRSMGFEGPEPGSQACRRD